MRKREHVPVRMCAGCRKRRPKEGLLRLVLDSHGKLVQDRERILSGRGAYVCFEPECLELAVKKKGFIRAFRGRFHQGKPEEVLRVLQEARECQR